MANDTTVQLLFISSYNISVPNDSHCIISFVLASDFRMLLLGKTQKKHPGDLPHMVPDLPLQPPNASCSFL